MPITNKIFLESKPKELPIIFQVDVSSGGGLDFTIPHLVGYNYDYEVDYGDGSVGRVTSYNDPWVNHTYAEDGGYTITMKGVCESLNLSSNKVININSLGNPKFKTLSFSFCRNLSDFNSRNNANITGVSNINSLFRQTNLTTIDLEHWDVGNVTTMSGTFSPWDFAGSPLQKVYISKWNTSACQNMYAMFYLATNLEDLDLSNWDVGKVENMEYMFRRCDKLTNVGDLSNWNTSNVTNMTSLFDGCAKLKNLESTGSWDVSNVETMNLMFSGCQTTEYLNLNSWNISKVSTLTSMFAANSKLRELHIENWDVSICNSINGIFSGCSSLNIFDVSSWNTHNINNMSSTFNGLKSITSIDLPLWDTSNVNNMLSMFRGNILLETISGIENWNVSNVTNMSYMFSPFDFGGGSLKNLDISNWNVSKVQNFLGFFYLNKFFESLDLSQWDPSSCTIASTMFKSCNSLISIGDVSSWNTSSLTNVAEMFSTCSSLDLKGVWNWDISNVTNFTSFAYGCNFDPSEYDLILEHWSAQDVCTGMSISFGNTKYSNDASVYHKILTDTYNWTIDDGGIL